MKVNKLVSYNLMGESREQEAKRLLNARIKSMIKGQDREAREQMRRGGSKYLVDTTPAQRKKRRDILKKAGLPY